MVNGEDAEFHEFSSHSQSLQIKRPILLLYPTLPNPDHYSSASLGHATPGVADRKKHSAHADFEPSL